jgi:hypothetical protein
MLRDLLGFVRRFPEPAGFVRGDRPRQHGLVADGAAGQGAAGGRGGGARGDHDGGLIGRTVSVSDRTADVLLLSDPSCKVSVRLARSGVFGVVAGWARSRASSRRAAWITF